MKVEQISNRAFRNACQHADIDVIKSVLEYASPNEEISTGTDMSGGTNYEYPINIILTEHRYIYSITTTDEQVSEAVEVLLEKGADPNTRYTDHYTYMNSVHYHKTRPLHVAVKLGFLKTIETLLKYNANINEIDVEGNTALTMCSHITDEFCNDPEDKSVKMTELLLKNGASLSVLPFREIPIQKLRNPLFTALYHGNIAVAKVLVDAGARLRFIESEELKDSIRITSYPGSKRTEKEREVLLNFITYCENLKGQHPKPQNKIFFSFIYAEFFKRNFYSKGINLKIEDFFIKNVFIGISREALMYEQIAEFWQKSKKVEIDFDADLKTNFEAYLGKAIPDAYMEDSEEEYIANITKSVKNHWRTLEHETINLFVTIGMKRLKQSFFSEEVKLLYYEKTLQLIETISYDFDNSYFIYSSNDYELRALIKKIKNKKPLSKWQKFLNKLK